jgi:hypothetical protein
LQIRNFDLYHISASIISSQKMQSSASPKPHETSSPGGRRKNTGLMSAKLADAAWVTHDVGASPELNMSNVGMQYAGTVLDNSTPPIGDDILCFWIFALLAAQRVGHSRIRVAGGHEATAVQASQSLGVDAQQPLAGRVPTNPCSFARGSQLAMVLKNSVYQPSWGPGCQSRMLIAVHPFAGVEVSWSPRHRTSRTVNKPAETSSLGL